MDVATLCLSLLSLKSASGYEIRKQLVDGPVSLFHGANYGSIYPALARLAAEGLIAVEVHAPDGRLDKKVYRITPEGRTALRRSLLAEPAHDRIRSEFLFLFFFAALIPPARVGELLDRYIARHREVLAMLSAEDCVPDNAGQRFVHGLGLAIFRARLDYLEANAPGLRASLDAEAGGAPTRGGAKAV
ncbi:MAG: PadR family transcriptional regulator [Proteobacteria bacterium]|nr:PadR family transcriptional regulator [Pseudomonadota bacterium]